MKRILFTLCASLLMLTTLYAQRKSYVEWQNQDMDSLLMWFKDGAPTDFSRLKDLEFKRSHVRPRAVIVDRATQLDTSIDPRRSVFANLPIGADDLLTGLPSGNFDEDVFSAWPYVKIHGNWSNPWFTAPAAYSDAAHKHGTAVLSAWFFSWDWNYAAGKTKAQDGNAYKIELMTKKDGSNNFIYAEPMMRIMQYFGMDGINYNSECFFNGASADMQALHKKLYSLAKERNFNTFHVGWYNSVSNSGNGHGSRSSLSDNNDKWYYSNGEFVSDAFMLDYGWGTPALSSTKSRATSIGAPNGALDVYGGMWLVAMGSPYFEALDAHKEVSIGLWGEHKNNRFFNHRSGDDLGDIQKSYQDRLEWFFSGKTQNPLDAKTNPLIASGQGTSVGEDSYLKAFHGIAKHVAERSTVQGGLPFGTNFNLGNGIYYYDRGVKTLGQWYNLSAQDMIPTYRWLITNASGSAVTNVKARFSHDDAWMGGSTLLLEGTAKTAATDVTLYRTKLGTKKNSAYSAKPATPKDFSVEPNNECAAKLNLKLVWSMSDENKTRLVYNDEVNVDHFEIFLKRTGEEAKQVATTASWAHFLPSIAWKDGEEQSFEVGVRAVAQDLTTTSEIAWATVTRNPAAAAVDCGGGGDYCEGMSYTTAGTVNAPTLRWFKTVSTTGADHDIDLTGVAATDENSLGYSVFSGDTIKVKPGNSFTFKANDAITASDDQYNLRYCTYRIWVDWNRDKVFAATAERIAEVGSLDTDNGMTAVKINMTVNVPADAAPGLTCMRIRYADAWGPRPIPCGGILAGYTADIYILVEGEVVEPVPEPDPVPPSFNGPTLNTLFPNAYLVYRVDGATAGSASNLSLLLKKKGAETPKAYPLGNATLEGWNEVNIPLNDYAETDTIVSVGLRVQSSGADQSIKAYIGELKLLPGVYQRPKVTVSAAPTVTDFAITSSVLVEGADTLVDYGNPLEFTFKVSGANLIPGVTVNGASTTYTDNAGVYTVSIAAVTEDLSIAITTAAPRTVTVSKPAQVEILSASAPATATAQEYALADGSSFTLTFRVNGAGYDVPKVKTGSIPYALAAAVEGVYTVTLAKVDADTSISITVALRRLEVSVTAGAHVALQTPASDTVTYGGNGEVRFTLDVGYNPVVKINNVTVTPAPTADEHGVYAVAIPNVTAATAVEVSAAIQKFDVTLSTDANVNLVGIYAGTTQVDYGGSYPLSFEVITNGYEPVVTVNDVRVDPGAPDETGLYSHTVENITDATLIHISAKQPEAGKVNVILTADAGVTLGAGTSVGITEVAEGSDFAFSFKVAEGYDFALTVGSAPVTPDAPNAEGFYSYTVTNITAATNINISAQLRQFDVTLTATSGVTLGSGVTAGVTKVGYGGSFSFTFGVAEGYELTLTVNGSPVSPGAPNVGFYSYTVTNITAATTITIVAMPAGSSVSGKVAVILMKGDNVTLAAGVDETTQVDSLGSFTFGFKVAVGYLPLLTVNGANVTDNLAAPDAGGWYSYTLASVAATTTVSIAAQETPKVSVTLTKGANVILGGGLSAGTKQVALGGDFPFSFRVADGYLPVVKVNGAEVDPGAPDATGLYRDTVYGVTTATAIDISAKLDDDDDDDDDATGVEALAADAPRFYPNPASSALTFVNAEKVSIYTVSGALVGVYTEATISIAHLPAGVYVVKMQRGSYTRTAQLVKN